MCVWSIKKIVFWTLSQSVIEDEMSNCHTEVPGDFAMLLINMTY